MTGPPRLKRSQLVRLLQIVLALQSGRRPNARSLATACEVSRRTIFRDLEAIEAVGLRVEYDPARQGYRIASESAATPVPLVEDEALALLVLASRPSGDAAAGLARDASLGLAKLMTGMPEEARNRLERVVRAIQDGPNLGLRGRARREVLERIVEAIARGVEVDLTLGGPGVAPARRTRVAPYRLLPSPPDWALIGRSSADRGVRLFALADLTEVVLTDRPFAVPPRFDALHWLARGEAGSRDPGRDFVGVGG